MVRAKEEEIREVRRGPLNGTVLCNGKRIAGDCRMVDSLLGKTIGLMFGKRRNLLFRFTHEKSIPIHSFFVGFPFYAVYIDARWKVVETHHVKPFTSLVKNKKKAKYLLELAEFGGKHGANGRMGASVPRAGDRINIGGA